MEEVEFQRQSQGPLSTERLFQAGDDLNWASVLSLPSEPPSLLVPLPCPCTAHFQMSPELTYHTADKPSSLKETPEALLLGADPAPRKQVSHFGFASRGAQKAAEDAVCFPTPEGTGGGAGGPGGPSPLPSHPECATDLAGVMPTAQHASPLATSHLSPPDPVTSLGSLS